MKILSGHFFPRVRRQRPPLVIERLPSSVIASNWKTPDVKTPTLLARNAGDSFEEIARHFVETFSSQKGNKQALTFAGEMKNVPNERRPFRVLTQVQFGSVAATDVILQREGSDLYVSFELRARTVLTYLRRLWFGALFLALLALFLVVYLRLTNARETWAKDYADKHVSLIYPGSDPDAASFLTLRILNGYYTTDWLALRKEYASDAELVKTAGEYYNEYGYPGPADEVSLFARVTLSQEVSDHYRNLERMSEWEERDALRIAALTQSAYWDRFPEYLIDYYLRKIPGNLFFQFYLTEQEEVKIQMSSFWRERDYSGYVLQVHSTHWVEDAAIRKTLLAYYDVRHLPEMKEKIAAIFDRNTTWTPPMSTIELARADPRGTLLNFSYPILIFAALLSFFIWRSPLSWLRFPCRLFGLVLPDDFNNRASAGCARIRGMVSDLLEEHGVGKESIIELND